MLNLTLILPMIIPTTLNLIIIMYKVMPNQLSKSNPILIPLLNLNKKFKKQIMMIYLMLYPLKLMIKEEKLKLEDINQVDIQMITTLNNQELIQLRVILNNLMNNLFNLINMKQQSLKVNPKLSELAILLKELLILEHL